MRIGKRLFPYPIVNNDRTYSCFANAKYSLETEPIREEQFLILKDLHYSLDSDYLSKLIDSGDLRVSLIVECSSTVYRNVFDISTVKADLSLPIEYFRGKVEFSCFIWAAHDFVYTCNDFQDDYSGYSFPIEKYSIIGADDGFTAKIEYDEEKDKKLTSIFSIICDSDRCNHLSTMSITPKKIMITLPTKEFNIYDTLKTNEYFQNIFFSILAIPALAVALTIAKDCEDINQFELDFSWFISVEKAYEKVFNEKLTLDTLRQSDFDPYKVAQALLNDGTVNAINDIYGMTLERSKGLGGDDGE